MKRFKKINILKEIRLLSLLHLILPVLTISLALITLNVIDFNSVFHPTLYKNSFDAYSAYTKGENNITVSIPLLKYTGYNIMKGDEVSSVYYYDLSSDKCMFYKLDMNYKSVSDIPEILENVTISAKFEEPDGLSRSMMESFAKSIQWTYDGLASITFPVIMDEHDYNPSVYYIFYGLLIILVFYSLYLIAINLLIVIAPYLHPAYIRIKPYFKDMRYFDMVDMINDELDNNICVTSGRMYITSEFFINLGRHEVSIMPLNQIVLAYNHGQLISFFGIHIKMDHTLHLRGFKNIRVLASQKKATHVTIVTDYIREHYPNIIWGHTKENIKAYKQILETDKASSSEDNKNE